MFAALGTVAYGAREIARNRDDIYKRTKLFWEIESLTVFTTLICMVLWGFLIQFSGDYKIFYIILTMNLFNTMFDISWFYTGLEQFKYTIIQNSIFKIIGVILLFVFVKNPNDVWLYILIMSLTTLLGTMSMWIYLPKFLKKIKISELKIFRHFKETLIYFVPTIATSVYTVLDKTLIGAITKNESQNGYYEQATKVVHMASALTFTPLNTVLGSRISYLFKQNKEAEIKEKIDLSINYVLTIGIGLCFGIIAVIDKFVPLFFGQGYDETAVLLKILSPLVIIIGISNCLGSQYYNPAGLRKKSAKFIIIGAIINLVMNLILIPVFLGRGAAIATIIAELVITLLYLKFSNSFYTLKLVIKNAWKKIIAGIVMLVIIKLLNFIIDNDIAAVIIETIVGTVCYLVVLVLLKDSIIKRIKNTIVKNERI
jgi:O-antigen/teichoic acid export membrane protein